MSTATGVLLNFHLRSAWHWRSLHYGRLLEPLLYYGLLVPGLGSGMAGGVSSYASFTLPGMLAFIALRAGMSTMIDAANDRKWGVFALALTSGLGRLPYLFSLVLHSALMAAVQVAGVLVMSWLLGNEMGGSEVGLVLVFIPVLTTWVIGGAVVGLTVNSYHMRDMLASLLVLPAAFTAPLFYSMQNAPHYIQWLSTINPLSYHAEWMRSVHGSSMLGSGNEFWSSTVVALGTLALAIVITRRTELITSEMG